MSTDTPSPSRAERESAAAAKAVKALTNTVTGAGMSLEERARKAEAEMAANKFRQQEMTLALTHFREQGEASNLMTAAQKAITFDEAQLSAALKRAFELGHKAGFAAGLHHGRLNSSTSSAP